MAAVRQPFGLRPSRSLNGNFNPATRRYVVEDGNRPTFVGDPVGLVSGNIVRVLAIPATANNISPIGVVSGLLDSNQKPLVFSQPTRGPFLAVSAAGFADVFVDPDNIYWASTDTTANATHIGQYVSVTAFSSGNANNRSGRSPIGVQLAVSTTAAAARPFKILGPSPQTRDYLTNVDWIDGVEVLMVRNLTVETSAFVL